ncbi:RnfABCDGE type electron transport complex subunit B [Halioxenophilus sp. WMMB6]|uniref:RnfABCDGE type electron transport complex subunit B n=1 Tax=Halioxenophilus sp. WMMB6 TaxID=3073815 RepID=UPI00295F10CC|nr:RnfABCDGE type electron transport complex subunit B [Halioxenophilus sp. WMMB6]
MIAAIVVLTAMGLLLGWGLGYASRIFHVDSDPLVEEVTAMMPGTQCGQCGYAGCTPAAEAVVHGEAPVTLCPPGGKPLAVALADKLGVEVNLDGMSDVPLYAKIDRELCTGCMRCSKVCPTDAIVGANKQIHAVIRSACTGCEACDNACPEDCIDMQPDPMTLDTWNWPKPNVA